MARQKTEEPAPAAEPIALSVDATIQTGDFTRSRLFRAGELTPYLSVEDVPEALKPFIVDPSQAKEPQGRFGNYDLNVVYSMNPDGSRGRARRREVAELERAPSEQEWAEQAADAQATLDEETEAALADAYSIGIGLQLEAARLAVERRDETPAIIMQQRDAEEQEEEARVVAPSVTPTPEEKSEPKRRRK